MSSRTTGPPRRGLFAEWAPMNSADTQPQLHRCLERRRYAGGELRIDPTAARSFSWARQGHFLRFASLEVVETIAGWAWGGRITSVRRQFFSFPVLWTYSTCRCVGPRQR